jgi:uncharacterized phage protein (TIGR02218 family)
MRTPRNFSGIYDATSLLTHMAQAQTTLAVCMKMTPTVGSAIGFTSTTRNITGLTGHVGVTFLAAPGMTPTAVSHDVASVPVVDCVLLLTSTGITESDWLAGKWAHATVEIFTLNYEAKTMGELVDFKGHIHDGKLIGQAIQLELRGLSAAAELNVCDLTSPACRYNFGDTNCTKDLTAYTRTGQAVTTVTSQTVFRASGLATPTVSYVNGKVTWTVGANTGYSAEIKAYDDVTKEITLKLPQGYALTTADRFTIVEGCAKDLTACLAYSNVINIGSEPYTPTPEKAFRIPSVAGG